jgi:hypothetical protein
MKFKVGDTLKYQVGTTFATGKVLDTTYDSFTIKWSCDNDVTRWYYPRCLKFISKVNIRKHKLPLP